MSGRDKYGRGPLTRRETEVLGAWCRLGFYKAVAADLGCAVKTAEKHFQAIQKKLQLHGPPLAFYAQSVGAYQPPVFCADGTLAPQELRPGGEGI